MASPPAAEVSLSLSANAVTRLVEQFRCLAEVAEQLTYRLVDLEERLADQQRQMKAIREEALAADHGHQWQDRLDQTDLRLAQIETLLGGTGAPRSLRGRSARSGLLTSLMPAELVDPGADQDGDAAVVGNIFPEEMEQPFMDDDLQMPVAG